MSSARILELRGEREALEARLAEITSDIDAEVVGMLRAGVSGQKIAAACGWSKQRVSQIRARALLVAPPEMGPGEAEMALLRSSIASRGGRAAGVARRARAATDALLADVPAFERADALRFIARQGSDELRPLGREEALAWWLELRAARRGLVTV